MFCEADFSKHPRRNEKGDDMKYSKEELLAMMPPREEVDPMFQDAMTRSAIAGRNGLRGEIAAALADKLQKPQSLSLSDCGKIVEIVSDQLPAPLTQNGKEYMAELIHAELKKGE